MTTLGQALAEVMQDFGIGGYIFGCEASATEITIWRSVQTSDGSGIALFQNSDGEITEACSVAETFDLNGAIA